MSRTKAERELVRSDACLSNVLVLPLVTLFVAQWLLFNRWPNPYFYAEHNLAAWIKQVSTSHYVITADELPSFK